MKEIIAKFCLILIFIISSSCGYKVLDNQKSEDLNIKEVKTTGDNLINFKIKNSLIINSSESKTESIIMELYTEKKKEFNIISTGNYQVSDKYSSTLKNEKRLIDDLTNDISDKIKKQINLILNDL